MKLKKKPFTGNRFDSLSPLEKKAIYEECERLSPLESGRPLTSAQRTQHRRAHRKAGRPMVGGGAEKVRISLERTLLKKTDALAAKSDISRSQIIATALRRLIADAA